MVKDQFTALCQVREDIESPSKMLRLRINDIWYLTSQCMTIFN
jgi:hypothetical protein